MLSEKKKEQNSHLPNKSKSHTLPLIERRQQLSVPFLRIRLETLHLKFTTGSSSCGSMEKTGLHIFVLQDIYKKYLITWWFQAI